MKTSLMFLYRLLMVALLAWIAYPQTLLYQGRPGKAVPVRIVGGVAIEDDQPVKVEVEGRVEVEDAFPLQVQIVR